MMMYITNIIALGAFCQTRHKLSRQTLDNMCDAQIADIKFKFSLSFEWM